MNALEIKGLRKSYPGFCLEDLNLVLPCGCIMGLIGENGAGKTTTMKLILDMIRKDEGSITILGRDNQDQIRLTKEEIGVVLDEPGLPECLNVRQVGRMMKHIYANWDGEEYSRLIERLDLPERKPFKDFSRGMKMKLGIAIALSHHSRLLLLDEATTGLDPVVRDGVLELFNDFTRQESNSILFSSHIVSDLEKLCDYIAFLHKGRLLLCEEKDRLLEEYGLVHCTAGELEGIPEEAIRMKQVNPYGMEVMVRREGLPSQVPVSPISIEELFVFMVKEAG